MSGSEIDEYLAALPEPKLSTLERLRSDILECLPSAEQCISYSMPAFRVDGFVIAGFAAFTNHLAYLPHSGSVFPRLSDALTGYVYTNGSLHFAVDTPLPKTLVASLIDVKLALINSKARRK